MGRVEKTAQPRQVALLSPPIFILSGRRSLRHERSSENIAQWAVDSEEIKTAHYLLPATHYNIDTIRRIGAPYFHNILA